MYLEILQISLIIFMFTALGDPGEIFAWYQKLIDPLPDWLNKPLGGCGKCMAGQVMFWYYIFTHDYNLIEHLFYVSLTIFLVNIYSLIWYYENP